MRLLPAPPNSRPPEAQPPKTQPAYIVIEERQNIPNLISQIVWIWITVVLILPGIFWGSIMIVCALQRILNGLSPIQ